MRRTWILGLAVATALCASATAQAAWEAPAGTAGTGEYVTAETIGGVQHVGWVGNLGRTPQVARQAADGLGWTELGAGGMARGGGLVQRIALAEAGGQLYAAWAENDQAGWLSPRVSRYEPTTDSWVPAPEGISDFAGKPDFDVTMVAHQDRPHVAFVERDPAYDDAWQVKVKRLSADGTTWERVGGPINASSQAPASLLPILKPTRRDADAPDLLSVGDSLYVAWSEYDGSRDKVRVARYDAAANAWREFGGGTQPVNESGSGQLPSLAAVGGVLHVAWQKVAGWDRAGEIRVSRMRADGSGFDQVVDAPVNAGAVAQKPSLADVGGRPWVSFIECPSGCGSRLASDVRVARLNGSGTAWEQPVDAPVEGSGDPRSAALAVVGGVPVVATDAPGVQLARLAPDILETTAVPDRESVTLTALVRGHGLPWAVGFEVDGRRTATQALGTGDEETVTMVVGGLRKRTHYTFRAFATGPIAPDVLGPEGTFRTGPGR